MNKQKIAIVTGSSRGIGYNIAQCLLSQGYFVNITSRSLETAKKIALELDPNGENCRGYELKLGDNQSAENLIQAVTSAHGQIDVLVNNALDNTAVMPLDVQTPEMITSTINSNITSNMLLCYFAYPHLKAVKGNIINIGSVVVNRHVLGIPLYTICKGAVNQMTQVLASEWASDGIRVNAINPGVVYTQALKDLGVDDETMNASFKHMEQFHPLGRIGEVEDIGQIVAYLCSEQASFITGTTINADGGYSVQGIPPNAGWTG